jgi:hypothetical protein
MKFQNYPLIKPDIDDLAPKQQLAVLIEQQLNPMSGFMKLQWNLQLAEKNQILEIEINSVPVVLAFNPVREVSVNARTFEESRLISPENCFLCKPEPGQRGFLILKNQYIVLLNPGLTFPGDITLVNVRHQPQQVSQHFTDMLEMARIFDEHSIYFNGALAGATSTHLHFQAGLKDLLIGERQIKQILAGNIPAKVRRKIIISTGQLELYLLENYLRPVYLVCATDANILANFFKLFIVEFIVVSHKIKESNRVPAFGAFIPAMGACEQEPRMNLMLQFNHESDGYVLAIFPKRFNRPRYFYRTGIYQIRLGIAIKEALGHVITCREKDFDKLIAEPGLIQQAYNDTFLEPSLISELNFRLERMIS